LLEEGFTVIVPVKSAHEIKWLKAMAAIIETGSLVTLNGGGPDELYRNVFDRGRQQCF